MYKVKDNNYTMLILKQKSMPINRLYLKYIHRKEIIPGKLFNIFMQEQIHSQCVQMFVYKTFSNPLCNHNFNRFNP